MEGFKQKYSTRDLMLTIIIVNFGVIELGWGVMTTMYLGLLEELSAGE